MRSMLVIAVPALLAACGPASTYRPAVDLSDAEEARYEIDLYDCKRVAERDRYMPLFVAVVTGASVGTALGAAGAGLAVGNAGLGESYGAVIGAVGGAIGAASEKQRPPNEEQFVDQCLQNNGYVLTRGKP
jgi:hypothetical protein